MFQADYLLKELSMGKFDQPVVGMKSCLDFADTDKSESSWTGREWFTMKNAEMKLSDDDVLVPVVKMGVEACQYCYRPHGCTHDPYRPAFGQVRQCVYTKLRS